jgi:hypothetical protein
VLRVLQDNQALQDNRVLQASQERQVHRGSQVIQVGPVLRDLGALALVLADHGVPVLVPAEERDLLVEVAPVQALGAQALAPVLVAKAALVILGLTPTRRLRRLLSISLS